MKDKINYSALIKEVSKLKKENEKLKKILADIENIFTAKNKIIKKLSNADTNDGNKNNEINSD